MILCLCDKSCHSHLNDQDAACLWSQRGATLGPGLEAARWGGAQVGVGGALTTMPLIDTQQLRGKSCSMGTRNCRQPSQWQSSSIMPMRLKIRTTALARSYVMWKICGHTDTLTLTNDIFFKSQEHHQCQYSLTLCSISHDLIHRRRTSTKRNRITFLSLYSGWQPTGGSPGRAERT